jgi:oligoendopeptidase F
MIIEKPKRSFVKEQLTISAWEDIAPFFKDLIDRPIDNINAFIDWLKDISELEAVLEEEAAWRYIKMTIDTSNEIYSSSYTKFVTEIQPEIAPQLDQINKKIIASKYIDALSKDSNFAIYFRAIKNALDLFRQENIPLEAAINEKSQLFGSISGAQTIEHEGNQITMQKAASLLKLQNESLRKEIFVKMSDRRKLDILKLDELYSELISMRHDIALNAGFSNYRDYMFKALGRFDYTKEDCFNFHRAIKTLVVPLVIKIQKNKLEILVKEAFKPWDLEVDPTGKEPLKPFVDGEEMLEKTIQVFDRMDGYFSDCLKTMKNMGYLDLDSKKGKAPGGYNYPLYEIGVPFIFMNAVGSQKDLVTMVHEGGHAIHSFLSRDLLLTGFKNLPSEVAELASMSMELLSMKYWDAFYPDEDELKRAKKDQLESVISILPWIAQIDEFQHWVYENPLHSHEERKNQWIKLSNEYSTGLTDWNGYEEIRFTSWQRQMHLFEVPFYYIEYGIAQLGALSVWRNSISNEQEALDNYKNALSMGYTDSISNIYQRAGVEFDFSEKHLGELMQFVENQLSELTN